VRALLIFYLSLVGCAIHAQDTLTVDRLDYRFFSYDGNQFSPLVSLESSDVAGVFVPCVSDVQVELCGESFFDIWVDGRLVHRKLTKGCEYLPLNGLCAVSNRDTVYLSLVADAKLVDVRARTIRILNSLAEDEYDLSRRVEPGSGWFIGFLICCAAIATLRMAKNGQTAKLLRPQFEKNSYRISNVDSWFYLLISIILSAFTWSFLSDDRSLSLLLGSLVSVISLLSIRLVVLFLSSLIFNFGKQSTWQFTFFSHSWMIVSVLMFGVTLIDQLFMNVNIVDQDVLRVLLSSMLGLFVAIETYILMTQRGVKSLHIFVYLCTVEILPSSLMIYWFLK
jgi:hypothetical protein